MDPRTVLGHEISPDAAMTRFADDAFFALLSAADETAWIGSSLLGQG